MREKKYPVTLICSMERTSIDQAVDLLAKEGEVLLLVPEKPSPDAFCAMIGLSMALEKLNKTTKMVSASHVPSALQFLPGTSQVQDYLEKTRDIVMDVPLQEVRPANVTWEQHPGFLRFIITPEKGRTFRQVVPTVQSGLYPWKLIVTLGVTDLNSLGTPFGEHAPFFYETPILNIDKGTANEFFGTVNLVHATAGTVTEVVYELLDALGGVNVITPEVATCLFAGILTGTRSFQGANTTPRTFAVASQLLEQDADRQTVTRNLFKTRRLPELRLLGRSLARLRDSANGVLWSVLLQKDFEESGGKADDVPIVLQEMVERAGEQTPLVLAFERTKGTIETLITPGKVSKDDRELLRSKLNGTITGQFVLATLGEVAPHEIESTLRSIIIPNLPRQIEA